MTRDVTATPLVRSLKKVKGDVAALHTSGLLGAELAALDGKRSAMKLLKAKGLQQMDGSAVYSFINKMLGDNPRERTVLACIDPSGELAAADSRLRSFRCVATPPPPPLRRHFVVCVFCSLCSLSHTSFLLASRLQSPLAPSPSLTSSARVRTRSIAEIALHDPAHPKTDFITPKFTFTWS